MIKFIAMIFLYTGCATVQVVTNPPEAQVTIYDINGNIDLGEKGITPFKMEYTELSKNVGDSTLILLVEKEGFKTEKYIIPFLSHGDLNISINLEQSNDLNGIAKYNDIIKNIMVAYQDLTRNANQVARQRVDSIIKNNENLSSPYIIQGISYLQENKSEQAKQSLDKAIQLDPNDQFAKDLRRSIP